MAFLLKYKKGDDKLSYGIVRVQKFSKGSVQGISIHDKREKQSLSNPDIDIEKSNLNYNLSESNLTYHEKIKERISELDLKKAVRKDAVVMAQVLVTSDSDFFKNLDSEKQKEFFQDSYNFLSERYGKENIVSATVHLDEKTPHMHFNFVPATADGRLSAKSLLTRQSLIEQQTAFQEKVGKHYGLERGMTKEQRIETGSIRKHMNNQEFKSYSSELEKLKLEHSRTLNMASKLNKQLETLENSKNRLQGKIEGLEKDYKGALLRKKGIDVIQPEKTILGTLKNITLEDVDSLKKTAIAYTKNKITLEQVLDENEDLISKLENARSKIPTREENIALGRQLHELGIKVKAFEKLPVEVQKELLQTKKSTRQHDLGHER